jgi:hypothetical protein
MSSLPLFKYFTPKCLDDGDVKAVARESRLNSVTSPMFDFIVVNEELAAEMLEKCRDDAR